MKNKGLIIKASIGLFVLLVVVLTGLYVKNNILLNRTYGYETGITNIAQYVDDGNNNVSSASFVFENIDPKTKENLNGNKVRIYSNDDVELSFLNTQTNDEVQVNNNIITLDENGITVKVNGISQGNSYDIHVEPIEVGRGYKSSYKSSTIALDYTNGLSAYVKEVIDVNNQPMELSEQDKLVFLYTDENDKIKLRANEDIDIEYYYSLDELTDDQLAAINFSTYNKDNYLKVETNGYLYAKAKYKTSAFSKISMLHITNIDKRLPFAGNFTQVENNNYMSATISFDIDDLEATKEYGKSEVAKYAFTRYADIQDESEWIEATAGTYTAVVEDNGIYYIHVMDHAGNVNAVEVNVNVITFNQPGYYILILDSTNVDLIGKVYTTLMQMKEDFDAHNLTNDDTVLAQIEGDIKNQYMDVENVNLSIDLNGYILESREQVPTFNVKNGAQLKIVDNKYEIEQYIHYENGGYSCNILEEPVTFDYTGEEQTLHLYNGGTYKLETWGAQGGSNSNTRGGYGAYSLGFVDLEDDTTLYINVGGAGTGGSSSVAGFNGGGTANHAGNWTRGAGGGATHIATKSGLLSNLEDAVDKLLIVAGGGGGAGYYNTSQMSNGGDAGGYIGVSGNGNSSGQTQGQGGTQTAGGVGYENGSFGQGANRANSNEYGGSGGGAGYYGGGSSANTAGGGGGSSYIGNELLKHKLMVCYNCEESDEANIRTKSVDSVSSDPVKNIPKSGNGYARVTKVECDSSSVDYADFAHGTHAGTVKNVNNDAIVVNEGATLQIGEENSPDLAHIEYPDHTSPYIAGKGKAITNRGTFNYYDGVVFGGIALDGIVQDSPYIYDPNVVAVGNDYRMTLEKVTNVEALIGKTRYTLLENAIDAANNRKGTPADQIKIDIVNDLAKDLIIEVNDTKNIILDLNGHTFTNVIEEPVMVNYGKTVIMDSGSDGIIINHNAKSTIENKPNAELTINSGIIGNDSRYQNTIFNEHNAKLTINGGLVEQSYEGNAVNNNGGIVNVAGGRLKANNPRWSRNVLSNYNALYNTDYYSDTDYDNSINIPFSSFERHPNVGRGFVENEDGSISPEEANAYYEANDIYTEIDLTEYNPTKQFQVVLTADLNTRESDYLYTYYRTDTSWNYHYENPNNENNRRTLYISGNQGVKEYVTTLSGGKKYYYHIGFYVNYSREEYPEGGNSVKITSVKLNEMHSDAGRVDITGGNLEDGQICLNNYSSLNQVVVNGGELNCYYSSATRYGDVTINDGKFNSQIYNSELKTYYINGGDVTSIWNERGYVRMSGGRVGSIINRFDYDYYNNLNNYAYITGGEIYNYIENYHILDVKNALISGTIYHYAKNELPIQNTQFKRTLTELGDDAYYSLYIEADDGDVSVKNSTFDIDISSYTEYYRHPAFHSIYKDGNSLLALDNVTMNMVAHNMKYDSNDEGNYRVLTGISNAGVGNIYLDNTKINASSDFEHYYTYGIVNSNKADIYIGKKDSAYEEDKNLINVSAHAIYSPNGLINFYDGVIKGNILASNDVIHEIEDGYYVYRYDNNGADTIKLVANNLGNVLNVTTNQTYNTLSEALDAAGSQATLRFLNNYNYETKNRTYEIKINQDISIDLNGKEVYFGNGFINNGKLKFINSSETSSKVTSQMIINNNDLSIEAGNWILEIDDNDGFTNNGKLTFKTSKVTISDHSRYENIIKNNGQLYIAAGAYISPENNLKVRIITNTTTGEVYMNGGELKTPVDPVWSRVAVDARIIDNQGGYVEINGGTINGISNDYYGSAYSIRNVTSLPEHEGGDISDGTIYLTNNATTKVPIDLSEYSGTVKIKVKYQSYPHASGYKNNMTINSSDTFPSEFDVETDETISNGIYEEEVTGGSTYYLHAFAHWYSPFFISDIIIEQNGVEKNLFSKARMVINDINMVEGGNTFSIRNFNADFTMNGGMIKPLSYIDGGGILNYRASDFLMTGGTIKNRATSVQFEGYSRGLFTGGNIIGDEERGVHQNAVYISEGLVNVEDLTINIDNESNGYDKKFFHVRASSTLNIYGGTYNIKTNSNGAYGLMVEDNAVVKIKDTTMTLTNYDDGYGEFRGVYMEENGAIDLENSVITAKANTSYGIYSTSDNTVNIINSRIEATGNTSYGYLASGNSTPTITLTNNDGDEDGHVSQTSPVLKGDDYGIYRKAGVFNYYDGIIKGETQIYGGVTDRPVGYELKYGNDGTINTVVLEKLDVVENIDTEVKYSTLESAFNACPNNEQCNLKLIYSINLSTNQTVPANKIVNFNLNNLTITTGEDSYLVNNGKLSISNGNLDIQGVDNYDSIIKNNGELYILNGTNMTTNDLIAAKLIINTVSGRLFVNGGTFESLQGPEYTNATNSGRVIDNLGGYVEINGGDIKAYSKDYRGYAYAIRNKSALPEHEGGQDSNGTIYLYNPETTKVPIDLSEYSGNVNIKVKYQSYPNNEGYYNNIVITTSETYPNDNYDLHSDETFIDGLLEKEVAGGSKYYLYAGTTWSSPMYISDIIIEQDGTEKSVFNRAKMVFNNINLIDSGDYFSIENVNGDIEFVDGIIKPASGIYGGGIINYRDATYTMTGGTIYNKAIGVQFTGYSHGLFNGGTIRNTEYGNVHQYCIYADEGLVDVNTLTIDIDDTNYSYDKYFFNVRNSSRLNVNGGTYTIDSPSNNVKGIYQNDNSTVKVKNATITLNTTDPANGIILGAFINSNAKLDIENSTLTVNAKESYGIKSTGSNVVNIVNSTVESSGETSFGYLADGESRPTVTITNDDGNADENVSITKPVLKGDTYGIYRKGGTFNYYDGIIKGNVQIYGGVSSRPEGYNLLYGTEGTLNTVVLAKKKVVKNINTNIEFDSIQAAINACPNDTLCNLKQIYKINMFEQVTIPANKIVRYDGDGLTILVVDNHNFVNRGDFTYINGTIEAQSITDCNSIIDNYGVLRIEEGTRLDSLNFVGARLIYNKPDGEVYMNGGDLVGTADPSYSHLSVDGRIIYNEGGYVEINGGKITGLSHEYYGYAKSIRNISSIPTDYTGRTSSGTLYLPNYDHHQIPIDLTNYSGNVKVQVIYDVEVSGDNPYGFYAITESESEPSGTFDKFIEYNTNMIGGSGEVELQGGRTYYLHGRNGDRTYSYLREINIVQGNNKKALIKRATMKINGGEIIDLSDNVMITNYNTNFEINGGTIKSDSATQGTGILNYRGTTLKMTGGEIKNKTTSISFNENSYGKFTGGTIRADETRDYVTPYGIYSNSSIIDIDNIDIYVENDDDTDYSRYGILVEGSSRLNVKGGNIEAKSYERDRAYGIYAKHSSIVQLGENDGSVDQYIPHITGTRYGVYLESNDVTFNFYDGRITSPGVQIVGEVDDIPVDYQIVQQSYDYYLDIRSLIENTVEYNKMYFEGLNMPIELIKKLDDKKGTIKLWNDTTSYNQVVIPEGLEITIALEGHQLDFDEGIEIGIINNGTLHIIDGYGDEIDAGTESIMINLQGVVIQNNGTLTIGDSDNPNRNSPLIKGKTAITGNSASLLSGKIESTEGGIIQTVGAFLANLFTFDFAEPSYAYVSNEYQVNNLPDSSILATSPDYRSIESLDVWTKEDIHVGMTSHNVGILNLVTDRDPNQTKEIEYTIEVYKNGILDEFYTYRKVIDVQYLDDDILNVDLDWFDGVEHKFKDYYLTKMTINDKESYDIPELVYDGTKFKLYYGQTKGEEIELNNPKTGRRSYKLYFVIALVASIFVIGFMMTKYIKHMTIKEDTI